MKDIEKLVWQDWLWRLGPHIAQIMAWRLSLIVGSGYYGDPFRFQEIFPDLRYMPFIEGVRKTYAQVPRHPRK